MQSIPFKFFFVFQILFVSFRLENLTMTVFDPLVATGNPQCWKSLFWHPAFLTIGELCLPILNFRFTRGGHLVLNFPIWSTDSYSSTVVQMKLFARSVLSFFWLHFLIILPEGRYFFIYVCQGWIKLVLVLQS